MPGKRGVEAGSKLVGFQNHLCQGELIGVRQREMRMRSSQLGKKLRRPAVKSNRGPVPGHASYFYIEPGYPPAPSRTNRLHRRFLRRKACCISLILVCLRLAIADLFPGENPFNETKPEALDASANAVHFCYVNTYTHDHGITLHHRGEPVGFLNNGATTRTERSICKKLKQLTFDCLFWARPAVTILLGLSRHDCYDEKRLD